MDENVSISSISSDSWEEEEEEREGEEGEENQDKIARGAINNKHEGKADDAWNEGTEREPPSKKTHNNNK